MNTPENSNTASPSAAGGADTDWESRYLDSDTPWDKGSPHPALLDWLRKNQLTGSVLVPGCGAGHDVRAIAAHGATRVVGMDIAPSALQRARHFKPAGVENYILGDFLAGEAAALGPFDWVFEHTCFCAIPPARRSDYASATFEALRPGGFLLAVFFHSPDNPNPACPPFASPRAEVEALFASNFEFLEVTPGIPTYPEREGREFLALLRRK